MLLLQKLLAATTLSSQKPLAAATLSSQQLSAASILYCHSSSYSRPQVMYGISCVLLMFVICLLYIAHHVHVLLMFAV